MGVTQQLIDAAIADVTEKFDKRCNALQGQINALRPKKPVTTKTSTKGPRS